MSTYKKTTRLPPMPFKYRSDSVSPAAIPSGISTPQAFKDYIEDVNAEIQSLKAAWRDFESRGQVQDRDRRRYENILGQLEGLKVEAEERHQGMSKDMQAEIQENDGEKWHTREDSNL